MIDVSTARMLSTRYANELSGVPDMEKRVDFLTSADLVNLCYEIIDSGIQSATREGGNRLRYHLGRYGGHGYLYVNQLVPFGACVSETEIWGKGGYIEGEVSALASEYALGDVLSFDDCGEILWHCLADIVAWDYQNNGYDVEMQGDDLIITW